MYLIGVLARKNRNRAIYGSIRNSVDPEHARVLIAEGLPPLVVSAIKTEGIEQIRSRLLDQPEMMEKVRLTGSDIKRALALFILVFFSTFPIILPFVMIPDTKLALRISNLVAIGMMFCCGWAVAGYVGFSKWKMSMGMVITGLVLVGITIALGG
jgi:VIT1/CCC1 family predicted Fe2+/Mn2+ transporter